MSELIEEKTARSGSLAVARLCRVAGLARSTHYRLVAARRRKLADRDKFARREVRRVALRMRSYGCRRIWAELQKKGAGIGRERVRRLMREENLTVRKKRRFVRTTDSHHAFKIWPNLAKDMKPTGVNQLWVADITYVHLARGFVYVAAILDAYSRRCIGWALGETLEATLTIAALKMALRRRSVAPGLVHHSDRGVQYACGDYAAMLKEAGIAISMSRRACPYDNAQAESFMKTLKCEEVYLGEYENAAEARRRIGRFLERVYNERRLHSALGYQSPAAFERGLAAAAAHAAA